MTNEPQITFFSGGSALNDTSRVLKQYTRRSVHIVTPFDSGGSSATLRQAFHMPAIGDLRSRLLALADESHPGNYATYRLLNYRLPKEQTDSALLDELRTVTQKAHWLIDGVPPLWQEAICRDIARFADEIPSDFDLRGASLGNLMIAGGYLENNCRLDPVIKQFSCLINVQGYVNISCDTPSHLVAHLSNNEYIIGQHRMTGKEQPALEHAINSLFLCDVKTVQQHGNVEAISCDAKQDVLQKIQGSNLICYAPGSFYSSLIANLLPTGITNSIAMTNTSIVKVYVPSLGTDPELPNTAVYDRVQILSRYLTSGTYPLSQLLNCLLYDARVTEVSPMEANKLRLQGIRLVNTELVNADDTTKDRYDPTLLSQALMRLATEG